MNRLDNLRKQLTHEKLSAFVVTDPVNIYYLSGFAGVTPSERESILVIDQRQARLIVHRMYFGEVLRLSGVEAAVLPPGMRMFEFLAENLKGLGLIGFEADNLKFSEYKFLVRKKLRLAERENFVEELRKVKDSKEFKSIKRAVRITDKAFSQILQFIKPGLKEREVAGEVLRLLESFGAGRAFAPIVASGPNSAKPHHVPGERRLRVGEPVLLDFGAKYKGYRSDMTRVIHLGKASEEFKKHYDLVLRAQSEAIRSIRPKGATGDAHRAVLGVFAGESERFTHSTGHGVGLRIHEKPSLRMDGEDILEEGMVVTVEPGLYFPKKYGIRIEDLGVVTKRGFRILSKSPKQLSEIL